MSVLVGIDPGESTGIAVVEAVGQNRYQLQHIGTYRENMPAFKEVLRYLPDDAIPSLVIVEKPPNYKPGSRKTYSRFVWWEDRLKLIAGVTVLPVSPGAWKPFIKAQGWQSIKGFSQHEADAYNMVRWYLVAKLKQASLAEMLTNQILKELENVRKKTG